MENAVDMQRIVTLMKRGYGDWALLEGSWFPKPLPSNEAGSSMEFYPGPQNATIDIYGQMLRDFNACELNRIRYFEI